MGTTYNIYFFFFKTVSQSQVQQKALGQNRTMLGQLGGKIGV